MNVQKYIVSNQIKTSLVPFYEIKSLIFEMLCRKDEIENNHIKKSIQIMVR